MPLATTRAKLTRAALALEDRFSPGALEWKGGQYPVVAAGSAALGVDLAEGRLLPTGSLPISLRLFDEAGASLWPEGTPADGDRVRLNEQEWRVSDPVTHASGVLLRLVLVPIQR